MSTKDTDFIAKAKELLELEKKATRGPWHFVKGGEDRYGWVANQGVDIFLCGDENKKTNAILIHKMRNNLRPLLEDYLRLVDKVELLEVRDRDAERIIAFQAHHKEENSKLKKVNEKFKKAMLLFMEVMQDQGLTNKATWELEKYDSRTGDPIYRMRSYHNNAFDELKSAENKAIEALKFAKELEQAKETSE